jgi:hypothetical protein
MGRGGTTWASIQSSNKGWLAEHKLNFLVQIGFKKEAKLPDVPLLGDIVKTEEDRQVVKLISLPTALGYTHWMAPGVPPERLAALRAAYLATLQDPEFLADAKKANMEIRPQAGAEIATTVAQVLTAPKGILTRTAKLLGWSHP